MFFMERIDIPSLGADCFIGALGDNDQWIHCYQDHIQSTTLTSKLKLVKLRGEIVKVRE